MVLRNRPTLPIGTERLACLNRPPPRRAAGDPRLQCSTRQVPGSSPGSGGRAFFSTLPSFLLREIVFFPPPPTNPAKVLGLSEIWIFFAPPPTNPAKVLGLSEIWILIMTRILSIHKIAQIHKFSIKIWKSSSFWGGAHPPWTPPLHLALKCHQETYPILPPPPPHGQLSRAMPLYLSSISVLIMYCMERNCTTDVPP